MQNECRHPGVRWHSLTSFSAVRSALPADRVGKQPCVSVRVRVCMCLRIATSSPVRRSPCRRHPRTVTKRVRMNGLRLQSPSHPATFRLVFVNGPAAQPTANSKDPGEAAAVHEGRCPEYWNALSAEVPLGLGLYTPCRSKWDFRFCDGEICPVLRRALHSRLYWRLSGPSG